MPTCPGILAWEIMGFFLSHVLLCHLSLSPCGYVLSCLGHLTYHLYLLSHCPQWVGYVRAPSRLPVLW